MKFNQVYAEMNYTQKLYYLMFETMIGYNDCNNDIIWNFEEK